MSRSTKKPILKDSPRNYNKTAIYWRVVRRVINSKVRQMMDEDLPQPREIVNDYDHTDYIIYSENKKHTRK